MKNTKFNMSKASKVSCGVTKSIGGCAVRVSTQLSQTAAALLFTEAGRTTLLTN